MRGNNWILFALAVVLALLVFFKPYYGWRLREFLNPLPSDGGAGRLASENEALKAKIAQLNLAQTQPTERHPAYIEAAVFSRYPLNFKNELLVNAGARDGIVAGRGVVFAGVLIGKIEKVFDYVSSAETIFDGRFKVSVRIGGAGSQALLQGGSSPKLVLISRDAGVAPGDVVYSVSPDFAYGLPIGEINEVGISPDQLFKETSLKLGYDINSIPSVFVEKGK